MYLLSARDDLHVINLGFRTATQALEAIDEFHRKQIVDIECYDEHHKAYTVEQIEVLAWGEGRLPRR